MGDTYVWTGMDTTSASIGGGNTNLDDPLNWFDQTTNTVATHAPQAADTAVFSGNADGLYPGGTYDGSGMVVTGAEFSPATLDIAAGAHVSFVAGESPPDYTVGTLEIGAGGSLSLVQSELQATSASIAGGGTLDLSQAYWIGAASKGPPGSAQQEALNAAHALGYPAPLNAVVQNLTIAPGGAVVLGNALLGVQSFTDQNPSGTGNAFAPLAGVSGNGTVGGLSEQGPYGSLGQPSVSFGVVTVGQSVTEVVTIYGSPGDLGSGVPTGAIQVSVNGGNITDPDLSGPGVTAQNFGTADYQPGGPVDFATFAITLDAQHVGALRGQAINLQFALNDGQYGQNMLVPITGTVVAAGGGGSVTTIATTPGQVIPLSSGNSIVFATVPLDIEQSGGASTIISDAGKMTINATGGQSLVFDSTGGDQVNESGSIDFIAGAGGAASSITANAGASDTIFALSGGVYNGAQAANSLFVGGGGAVTVTAAANETLFAGTGGGVYTPGNASFFFLGGGGADSIAGGSARSSVWGNTNERLTLTGTAGHAALIAFGDNDSIDASGAGGGNAFIVVNQSLPNAAGTFSGNTTLVGSSAGGDNFAVFSEPGTPPPAHTISIANWQASDTFFLGGYGSADMAAANAALAGSGGSVSFTLSDQTTIAFIGAHPTGAG